MELLTKLGIVQSPAGPVMDLEIRTDLMNLTLKDLSEQAFNSFKLQNRFTPAYDNWIHSSQLNSITGIRHFQKYMTFGITHSLDNFIIKNHNKRFRIFKAEYSGTSENLIGNNLNFTWLEDEEIKENDAVIISAPFSGHGKLHKDMYSMFEKASELNVPVMIDCAFWGLCHDIHLNLNYPCIKTVAFSLSKCFWMNNYRIGMEYSSDASFGIKMLNDHCHTARIGGLIAMNLFEKYSADFLPNKYKSGYEYICKELDYTPTNTLIFALSKEPFFNFKQYDVYNRVSISRFLHNYATLPVL